MTDGLTHVPGYWGQTEQSRAIEEIRELCKVAPLRRPSMPNGQPMRVRITSFGAAAWWSDERGGYRYIDTQPDGAPLPPAPTWILEHARSVAAEAGAPYEPDAVLINWYDEDAALGNHRDESEPDVTAPIVSFSLGAPCRFLVRGEERDSPISHRLLLESGDAVVMAPPCRNWFHEVARILPCDPLFTPLRKPGRISILVRKVTK